MPENDLMLTRVPSVKVGMGIRTAPARVFEALVDPAIATTFWFTKSSGRMEPGAQLLWEWEMYDASAEVWVKEIDRNSRILMDWRSRGGAPRTVEIRLTPWGDSATYAEITERGFDGDGDEAAAWAADSTGGFLLMLSALKALLEHDVILTVVLDHYPRGLDQ